MFVPAFYRLYVCYLHSFDLDLIYLCANWITNLSKNSSRTICHFDYQVFSHSYTLVRWFKIKYERIFCELCNNFLRAKHQQNVRTYNILNHCLRDLLFNFCFLFFTYVDFNFWNSKYGLICVSYLSHKEYARDEGNMNETMKVFSVTNKKFVALKSSCLSKVKPTKRKKTQSFDRWVLSFCFSIFSPVLRCNTVVYFARSRDLIW